MEVKEKFPGVFLVDGKLATNFSLHAILCYLLRFFRSYRSAPS
jgi:hypothetical protein